ncbi:SCO family protein [Bacteroidia bacterium]|nr:SCO family protein [Bacteroidia bacterium]
MPEKSKLKGRIFLVSLLAVIVLFVVFLSRLEYKTSSLPYLGERFVNQTGDTVYHEIEQFKLTTHLGIPITKDSLLGKIHLASFFFSTCPEVCPAINNNINLIVHKFRNISDVHFVSYTVDPETDSVATLAQYAERYENPLNWHFVTGPKSSIYRLAEFSYLAIGSGASQKNWAHTEQLTLVDEKGHIRGIFQGRGDQRTINEIIDAIKLLRLEKNRAKKKL